jgi:hypothetical protein
MKKIFFVLLFVLLTISIVSCNIVVDNSFPTENSFVIKDTISPVTTNTPYQLSPTKIMPTIEVTPTFAMVSPTSTTTQSSIKVINNEIKKDCFNILSEIPQPNSYEGVILVSRTLKTNENYLLNIATGIKTDLPLTNISTPIVSPDGKYFAFRNWTTQQTLIYSADNHLITSYSNQDLNDPIRWLDNDHILFFASKPVFPTTVIYNLFTNETNTILTDFPNKVKDDFWAFVSFDSLLTRAVYPGSVTSVTDEHMGDILWNVPENKKIAEFLNGSWAHNPVWSVDGSKFIILLGDKLTVISRDGIILNSQTINNNADYFSWSPDDGRHVAFWLQKDDPYRTSLIFLDTVTEEMTDSCIQGGFTDIPLKANPAPAWSLEGDKLMVLANLSQSNNEKGIVLVDLDKKVAVKIAPGGYPMGWLTSP